MSKTPPAPAPDSGTEAGSNGSTGSNIATASVTTPPTPQAPSGHEWDMLAAATTRDEVLKVADYADRHGYSPEGQFQKAIAARLAPPVEE